MVEVLEQTYEQVAARTLTPHPRNARRGSRDVLAGSLSANGFYGALIVQRSTRHVLVGNHRLAAALEAGVKRLPVLWVDVDDAHALRILLMDNRSSDLAGYDEQLLAEVLQLARDADPDLSGTGWSPAAAAEAIAAMMTPEQRTDPDDAPAKPPKKRTRSKFGDVWLLGEHRLVCGDATDRNAAAAALAGEHAAMVWTDPPYGVAYTPASGLTIANDDLAAKALGDELLGPAFGVAHDVLEPGGAFYVCSPSGPLETTFRLALDAAGLTIRQQLVWVKNTFVLGRSDYHGQHETIFYGWQLPGEAPMPPHFEPEHDTVLYGWRDGAAHTWNGGRRQSTVWQCAKPQRSADHPTMKPVDLVQRAIENSSQPGAFVLDLFAGSGSALIACHRSRRIAALVELDPQYVDVICRRWQEHTGQLPVLERSGAQVDFSKAA